MVAFEWRSWVGRCHVKNYELQQLINCTRGCPGAWSNGRLASTRGIGINGQRSLERESNRVLRGRGPGTGGPAAVAQRTWPSWSPTVSLTGGDGAGHLSGPRQLEVPRQSAKKRKLDTETPRGTQSMISMYMHGNHLRLGTDHLKGL